MIESVMLMSLALKEGLKTHLDKQVQIATYISSWAAFSTFRERLEEEKLSLKPAVMAGHSFGEYTALTAAEGMNYDTGLHLVNETPTYYDLVCQRY